MRIGSTFSGSGMLDLAVEHVLGGRTLWQVEKEAAARRVLQRHWPDAEHSCHDVREAHWQLPVDVIIGGFPCQDLSCAGTGLGLRQGERSQLFFAMAKAVRSHQPDLVIIENVPGLLKWRAVVEEELAGYACRWVRWSATSAGAPHLRRRVLVVATRGGAARPDLDLVVTPKEWARAQAEGVSLWPTPSVKGNYARAGAGEHRKAEGDGLATAVARTWPTPMASDAKEAGRHGGQGGTVALCKRVREHSPGRLKMQAEEQVNLWATPRASDDRGPGRREHKPIASEPLAVQAALWPTPLSVDAKSGRLAADWVECLMGWPVGWTRREGPSLREQAEALLQAPRWPRGRPPKDHEGPWPGHAWEPPRTRGGPPVRGRPARLRMCGNGVVPQALALALRAALEVP